MGVVGHVNIGKSALIDVLTDTSFYNAEDEECEHEGDQYTRLARDSDQVDLQIDLDYKKYQENLGEQSQQIEDPLMEDLHTEYNKQWIKTKFRYIKYEPIYSTKTTEEILIFDLAGTERHTKDERWEKIRYEALKLCHVVLMCFDLTRKETLYELEEYWNVKLKEINPRLKRVLVGLKSDYLSTDNRDLKRPNSRNSRVSLVTKQEFVAENSLKIKTKSLGCLAYLKTSAKLNCCEIQPNFEYKKFYDTIKRHRDSGTSEFLIPTYQRSYTLNGIFEICCEIGRQYPYRRPYWIMKDIVYLVIVLLILIYILFSPAALLPCEAFTNTISEVVNIIFKTHWKTDHANMTNCWEDIRYNVFSIKW